MSSPLLPNVGPKGIRYGVIDGRSVPEVLDLIFEQGTNIAIEELKGELLSSLCGADRGYAIDVVDQYVEVHTVNLDEYEYPLSEDSAECIIQDILDQMEWFECPYEYRYETPRGVVQCEVRYLGGVPLVFVISSPFVTYCRPCSPCIPLAGDLDSLSTTATDIVLAYCLPPEDMPGGSDNYETGKYADDLTLLVKRT